jgi:hypothetical protein
VPISDKTWIYGLVDPRDDLIKYVGKADKPQRRLTAHVCRAVKKKRPTKKDLWLKELHALGLQPTWRPLECVLVEEWETRERHWIALLQPQLTNDLPGGEGGATYGRLGKPWTEEHRKNYSAARKGLTTRVSEEGRAARRLGLLKAHAEGRITPAMQGKRHSDDTKRLMAERAQQRMAERPHTNPARYKRHARGYTWRGETHTLAEWVVILGIKRSVLKSRLSRGWTVAQTLGTPVRSKARTGGCHGVE